MATQHIEIRTESTERKAPTDESVRLLNEMQDKAFRNIVQRVNVTANTFRFAAVFQKDDLGQIKVGAKFNINGEDHYVETNISNEDAMNAFNESTETLTSNDLFHKAMRNKIAQVIAEWMPMSIK